MPSPSIHSLISLLDDETEEVRDGVQQALLTYQGDAADELAATGLRLTPKQAKLLARSLHPGRRAALKKEWAYPTGQLNTPDGDWESLEALLRLISDFLHDGITMRQSLSDEIDFLAEGALKHATTPAELSHHLFHNGILTGNRLSPFHVKNSDLAWSLQQGKSNPLGLSLIFMLVAQRLEMPVFGCNYPGHFLSLIDHQGEATIVDPFHNGRLISVKQLIKDHPEISKNAQQTLKQPCTLAQMLHRLLANLHLAFTKENRNLDAELIEQLLRTIRP